jgi:hypothetical protein
MAQFDIIIIFPLFWALILVLFLNYCLIINVLLPRYVGIKKFRIKLLKRKKLKISSLSEISRPN